MSINNYNNIKFHIYIQNKNRENHIFIKISCAFHGSLARFNS